MSADEAASVNNDSLPVPQYKRLPYGEQQGSFRGVVAGSNRDDGFFSGENNYVNHLIFTGFRYQCVEYARRFLLLTTGCVFDECGRASEVYKKTKITNVETGEAFDFIAHDNGSSTVAPQPGDVIIWPWDDHMCPWGHIGIISYVDDEKVGIAEQNQYFGSFVSPSPDYLDGERCVSRFLKLHRDPASGAWTIEESGGMPTPLGWMSYPGAGRREKIYEPLKPLPAHVAIRSTPMDDPKHPFLFHLRLPEPMELPCGGAVSHVYGLVRGTGETAVAAGTALSRILRFTLQLMFRRSHIGTAFLSLPANPLKADIKPCPALDPLFAVFEKELGTERDNESAAFAALASYFGVPERWIAAMQKEFAKGELHMFANAGFAMRAFADDVASDPLNRSDFCDMSASASGNTSNTASPTTAAGGETAPASMQLDPSHRPHKIRAENPHDEVWQLGKVNFGTCRMMVELPQLAAIVPAAQSHVQFQLPGYRCFGKPGYAYDFGNYLKNVEERRGPRTAFTIVLSQPLAEMDGTMRELVTTLQSYCEKIKYPVRVVAESDLVYDQETGKLFARISEASPPVASPTSVAPTGDFEVNFVFALAEWEEILRGMPNEHTHKALYEAAMDYEKSDVVFAKPLWSYLASGVVHRTPEEAVAPDRCDVDRHAGVPLSIKFYDIVRRLFDYALPRQAAESWDQEVSEFKDSCRRLGISNVLPAEPATGFVANCGVVNFAFSAFMAHTGGSFQHDPLNKQEHEGEPSAIFHVFSTEND